MTAGCPHCAGLSGTCCMCNGAKRVSLEVADACLRDLWARPDCGCGVCSQLEQMRAPCPPAFTAFDAPVIEVPIPDPDGTFRGHFQRRCRHCGNRRPTDAHGVYCSARCTDRAARRQKHEGYA